LIALASWCEVGWSDVAQYDLGPDDGAVTLIVIRIEFQAEGDRDRVSVWRNPAASGTAPSPDVSDAQHDIRFDRIALANFTRDGTCAPAEFDTIRFGATYASVTAPTESARPISVEAFDGAGYDADRPLPGQNPSVRGYRGAWRRTGGNASRLVAGSLGVDGGSPGTRRGMVSGSTPTPARTTWPWNDRSRLDGIAPAAGGRHRTDPGLLGHCHVGRELAGYDHAGGDALQPVPAAWDREGPRCLEAPRRRGRRESLRKKSSAN
jgi:hypothetical protein